MIINYSGRISIEDAIASIKERFKFDDGEAIKKIKVMLLDYTNATAIITTEDIKKPIKIFREKAIINPNFSLIGVMPKDLEFGLGRAWQAFAEMDEHPWESYVVRTIEEANKIIKDILNTLTTPFTPLSKV